MENINRIIKSTIKRYLTENFHTEVNNNLPIHEFDKDMERLGFTKESDRAGSRVIYHLTDGGLKITTHDPGKTAKADMLRNVFNCLKKIKWFDKIENFKKFPFQRWQFNPNSVSTDTTDDDIQQANELYKDAEVYKVFYSSDNPLCILHIDKGYNLCRSINDRRPLLDMWYSEFRPNGVPSLVFDDYENWETKVYPINQDGTLDIKNAVNESNNMKKNLIRLSECDLNRIIKESVNNILNEKLFRSNDNYEDVIRLSDMLLCPRSVKMISDADGNDIIESAYYKSQDLEKLYNNQDNLCRFERIVLNKCMWGRAMRANYHGYDDDFGVVWYKDGSFYVNGPKGKMVSSDSVDFKRICTPEFLSEPTTDVKYGL